MSNQNPEIDFYSFIVDHLQKAQAGSVKVGDSVSWNSSGGTARGKITRLVRSGTVAVPSSSFTIAGTEEDPAALIRLYRPDSDGKYKPTETIVGHKTSTLRKIESL